MADAMGGRERPKTSEDEGDDLEHTRFFRGSYGYAVGHLLHTT